MVMINLSGKVFKVGNSFGLRIPKAYVDDGNLEEGEEYFVQVVSKKKTLNKTQNKALSDAVEVWGFNTPLSSQNPFYDSINSLDNQIMGGLSA